MKDWILRNIQQHDWLSLIFLFNFILMVLVKFLNRSQFQYFIRFIDSGLYFKIYGKENQRLDQFTILGTLYLLSNLTLGIFYYLNIIFYTSNSFKFFLILLTKIIALVIIRYLFLELCFKILQLKKIIEIIQFKSLTYQIQISGFSFFLFLLYQFSFSNEKFFLNSLGIIIILYLISQITIYREYWPFFKHNILYLILYLCTFKLAPWIMLYSTFS